MKKKIITGLLILMTACTFNGTEKNKPREETKIDIPESEIRIEETSKIIDILEENVPVTSPGEENVIYIKENICPMAQVESLEETASDILEDTAFDNQTFEAVSDYDIELLACTIYCEAGSDAVSDLCRYYVADTILNRVDSPNFPNTIYEVLTAPTAYGLFHYTGVVWPDYSGNEYEKHAIERAYRISRDILVNGNHSWIYGNHYVYQSEYQQSEVEFYLDGFYFGQE